MRAYYISLTNKLEQYFRVDARYFLSGGFWLTLGQGITIIFGILTTALFAHYLSEVDYGIYKYLIGLAVLLSSLSLTGLGQSILQTAAKKYYGFYQATLKTSFLYSLPITLVSLGASGYYFLNNNNIIATGCLLIAILQPFINNLRFIHPFLQGSRRFKESVALHTAQVSFSSLISLGALYLTQNILWLFASYLVAQLLMNLGAHLYFRPAVADVPSDIYQRYLQYAKHTSLRNIIANVAHRADTVIVFTQLGAVELALYSIATVIPEQIKGSFKNLASLLLPKYAQHTDTTLLKKGVPKRSLQLFSLLVLVTAAYMVTAPHVYSLLFPKYTDAILLSQIASLSFLTYIFFIPQSILQAQLDDNKLYRITLICALFQIISIVVLVSVFGLLGAILSRVLYNIFFLVVNYLFLYRNYY